jgi:hypothetical protein
MDFTARRKEWYSFCTPRPPRVDFPDAVYHVTSGGNGRAEIFWSDDDRRRFLAQLVNHLHMSAVVVYAHVLIDMQCRSSRALRVSCREKLFPRRRTFTGTGASDCTANRSNGQHRSGRPREPDPRTANHC